MYTEGGGGDKSSKQRRDQAPEGRTQQPQQLIAESTDTARTQQAPSLEQQQQPPPQHTTDEPSSAGGSEGESRATEEGAHEQQHEEDTKPPARTSSSDQPSQVEATSGSDVATRPRQVIAVSASKGPAAFFNLARKFLVTDEMCDLSALEGAIVSAVDAAHLLERSKLATIVRVQTSYVTVEPKRKKQQPQPAETLAAEAQGQQSLVASVSSVTTAVGATASAQTEDTSTRGLGPAAVAEHPMIPPAGRQKPGGKGSATGSRERELRRARIVITVRRTEEYRIWLEENPLQAIIAGDGDDDENVEPDTSPPAAAKALTRKPP